MTETEQLERAQSAILQIRKALTGDIHSTTNLLDAIAELVAENERLRERLAEKQEHIDAMPAAARIEALEAALRPLAEAAEGLSADAPDSNALSHWTGGDEMTVGHARRARAALKQD